MSTRSCTPSSPGTRILNLASGGACVLGALLASPAAHATPVFARKQNLGCPVCHSSFPELNEVGRSFKENGYHFPDDQSPQAEAVKKHLQESVQVTGTDLGSGIILDKVPGIAVRVESVPFEYDGSAVSTTPLDAAELIMGGSNGSHWSYWAEIESAAEDGYVPVGNGLLQYRWAKELQTYAGWMPVFSRDPYNTISESRRIDHIDHAAQDYGGSIDLGLAEEAGVIGAFGRLGPVFYNVSVTPGPGVVPGTDDPMDYMGRAEVDLTKKVSVGGYVYSGNVPGSSTVRAAVDANALTSFGTFKVLGQYDTLDQATCVEAGWDMSPQVGAFWLVPQAHVDLTEVGGSTVVQPMAGLGLQQSAGRISVEVSDAFAAGQTNNPSAVLILDGLFYASLDPRPSSEPSHDPHHPRPRAAQRPCPGRQLHPRQARHRRLPGRPHRRAGRREQPPRRRGQRHRRGQGRLRLALCRLSRGRGQRPRTRRRGADPRAGRLHRRRPLAGQHHGHQVLGHPERHPRHGHGRDGAERGGRMECVVLRAGDLRGTATRLGPGRVQRSGRA